MLETIRSAARTWVAQLLFGLLIVSFAVWGMGDIASGFARRAATVGDQAVEADAFAAAMRREQQRFGVDPSRTREVGLDRFVLATLVREAAFDQASADMGLSVPDAAVARAVRSEASFQTNNTFDAQMYRSFAQRNYGSVQIFEDRLRKQLSADLARRAIAAGASAPSGAAKALAAYAMERRVFDLFTLDARTLALEPQPPTEAQLVAHLDENAAGFAAPERRKVVWLRIDPARLGEKLEISEEDLHAAYDDALSRFVTPERREVDQIVLPDQAQAEAAMARLLAGDIDFDGLLAEQGLTRADAALGLVKPGDLRDARDSAVFSLAQPGLVGPSETANGWAILDIRAITPGVTVPFEEARDTLRAEIAAARAAPDADRLVETVEDLRAGGATLEDAAAELDLQLGVVSGLARGGAEGGEAVDALTATQAFLNEAFAAEQGADRDFQRSDLGGWFVLRVDDVTPSRTPGLDEIRAQVAESWTRARRRELLAETAAAAAQRISDGADAAEVAAGFGAELQRIAPLRRGDPEAALGAEARVALFAAQPGQAAVSMQGDMASIARLVDILPAEDASQVEDALRAQLAAAAAQDQIEYFGRALEQSAGVALNQNAIDAAISAVGG